VNRTVRLTGRVVAAVLLAAPFAACSRPAASADGRWDSAAAAAYLDRRADWWMQWQPASRDHGTFCISCHTTLPYALARPSLRERDAAGSERRVYENVVRRVRLWNEIDPYYKDREADPRKSVESRGTESVLNALLLAHRDARSGRLSADARAALALMWATQETNGDRAGAWPWLQFGLRPWEADDSYYYGAALAALAVAVAPDDYRSTPAIEVNVARLRGYLEHRYAAEPLANRAVLLLAATKWPELMDATRRRTLLDELQRAQRSDGGWSLTALVKHPGAFGLRTYFSSSDGYATGLVTLVMLEAGTTRHDPSVERAVQWLVRNQNEGGFWRTESLNARRDPDSDVGRFMSDAATAYAVLALTRAGESTR
jgi:squalene-hopene/tetraprenyl-beta-curcumene cyclase